MKITVKVIEHETITISNRDGKKFRRLLKEGFHVCHRKPGHLIMKKGSKVMVTVDDTSFNMKEQLKKYYGEELSGKILASNLMEDLISNKVTLELDSKTGYYNIVKIIEE